MDPLLSTMDSCGSCKEEVSEEEYRRRLDIQIQQMREKSDHTSQAGLSLAHTCLSYQICKGRPDIPELPLNCYKFKSGDSLLQQRHCHFSKTHSLEFWKTKSSCNLGLRATPNEKWDRRHEAYRMQNWPRGRCIIIGNMAFGGLAEERHCSFGDVMRMRRLFLALHFDCTVAINLTSDEMKELLEWAAQPEQQKNADCLVVVLMSHGRQNYIYGVDFKPLHLYEDIYERFNNENCPALQGKPKLFFVQACRGGQHNFYPRLPRNCHQFIPEQAIRSQAYSYNTSVMILMQGTKDVLLTYIVLTYNTSVYETSQITPFRLVHGREVLYIAYATIPGFVALRDERIGSWFVSAMYAVFVDDVHNKSLDGLMRRIHALIVRLASRDGVRQTPCTEQLGWRKKLYFYPGRM
ncbi:caspase-14-like [Amblyomma americanum]